MQKSLREISWVIVTTDSGLWQMHCLMRPHVGLTPFSLQGVTWLHRLQAEIVLLNRSAECLVVLILASTRFSAMKMKGTSSQYAKCGIIPMIPPSIKDLRAILGNLMSLCEMPECISETNKVARDLLCDLCCGNYRIFQEALLAFNGTNPDSFHVKPGVVPTLLTAVQPGDACQEMRCTLLSVRLR